MLGAPRLQVQKAPAKKSMCEPIRRKWPFPQSLKCFAGIVTVLKESSQYGPEGSAEG